MIENLEKFNVKKEAVALFNTNSVHVIELNQTQMLQGKTKKNEGIGSYRQPEYADFKFSLSSEAGKGNVDLRLTGAFYKAMAMKITGENIDIKSADKKAVALQSKYGTDIFGLTKDNWQIWLDEVFMPDYMLNFEKATGLKA